MPNSRSAQVARQPIFSEKIEDSDTFGVIAVVSPEEAEQLGAFVEDALSPEEAWESQLDGEDADNG